MTTGIQERDLCRVRLRLLDLCKSFFDKEPDAEKLARWRGIFAALAKARISPAFDREAGMIAGMLWKKSLNELRNEYRHVLAEPSVKRFLATSNFSCRNGRNHHEVPADVHEFMGEAGLVRDQAATGPEDSPVFLLDILAALVEEEKTEDKRRARALQASLLTTFLTPLAAQLAVALKDNGADFYLCCGRLLCSYLELEVELIGAGHTIKIAFGTGTAHAGHRIIPHFGKARQALAGLFAATAGLSGAAMTARTIARTGAVPSKVQPSFARGRAILYPVKKANRLPDTFGEREAMPKRGLG